MIHANNREIQCPHQCFINGEFVDPISGNTFDTVNPTDESVICKVSSSGPEEVDQAVRAAKVHAPPSLPSGCYRLSLLCLQDAFYKGEWGRMNARDRGKIMYK